MAEKTVFDLIKKQNGEHFAKAIRNYDNGIFDIPGIVEIVKYAGRDAAPIMNFLVSLKNVQIEEHSVHMNPIDLLDMAGYKAYVADTLDKQNAIKKYFREKEELCTFRDPNRFKNYYIINAVKKECLGDDELPMSKWHIKPSDNPKREDEYGTSVISIQILKSGGFISIKNRYNHTVASPDNTFNSDPDKIIPGLSDAIKHYFDVDFSSKNVLLPDGYVLVKDKIIRYNTEVFGIYLGDDFYVDRGRVKEINKQTQLMLPRGLYLDLQTKQVKSVVGLWNDVLPHYLTDLVKDKKIQINKLQDGTKEIIADGKPVFSIGANKLFKYLDLSAKAPQIVLNYSNDYIDPNGVFDLSGAEFLTLERLDIDTNANMVIKTNPNIRGAYLTGVNGLKGNNLGFISKAEEVIIRDSDFVGQTIKFNPNAHTIILEDCENVRLEQNCDLSGVTRRVDISNLSVVGINIKFNPSTEYICLRNVDGLAGVYDFRYAEQVDLTGSSLSNVEKIIVNRNARVYVSDKTKIIYSDQMQSTEQISKQDALKKATEKIKSMVKGVSEKMKSKLSEQKQSDNRDM